MKKLALLISTTLLMGTQAVASVAGGTTPPGGSASADIFAIVPEACSVEIVNRDALETDMFSAADQTVSSPVRLICNTVNGANVTLSSENGALKQAERDIWADYTATLGLTGGGAATTDLVLEANARQSKTSDSVDLSREYLRPDLSYPLDIALVANQDLPAGRYDDRLTITLVAN